MAAPQPGAGEPVNRTEQAVFLRLLQEEIARRQADGTALGVLLVRLRDFRRLNLILDYTGGDRALAELAARLSDALGARGRVVRIGARTFALILRGVKGAAHVRLAAQKVQRLAEAPVEIDGRTVALSVAQGAALWPEHARSAGELLQNAESALKRAEDVDSAICLYDPTGRTALRRALQVEAQLLDALEDGGIEAHFQPIVTLPGRGVIGGEALLRCRDGSGGLMPPEEVIEAAQRLRRLEEVTSIMINSALRHAAEWRRAGEPLRVAINVSATSLRSAELVGIISEALATWDTPAEALAVEITESVFIAEPQKSFATMRRLRELGVRVSIDDFGTGYSSLAYFRDIPATELKVDKSFVTAMLRDPASRKIVHAVIELAHAFDLQTVGEGVEDEATADALAGMGCDFAQGYWFSRPLPPAEFWSWVSGQRLSGR